MITLVGVVLFEVTGAPHVELGTGRLEEGDEFLITDLNVKVQFSVGVELTTEIERCMVFWLDDEEVVISCSAPSGRAEAMVWVKKSSISTRVLKVEPDRACTYTVERATLGIGDVEYWMYAGVFFVVLYVGIYGAIWLADRTS